MLLADVFWGFELLFLVAVFFVEVVFAIVFSFLGFRVTNASPF
jgi:hypothetical protein